MTTSLENPLSSLSSGYFSSATSDSFKVKPMCNADDCLQVVTNELDDEEPNVLTNKPMAANDGVGFSHLDWSAIVPYNMADEPDDVQGKKSSFTVSKLSIEHLKLSILL